ncbi:MAG: hypothetical protein V1850_06500 [Candidatus Bathyarchaeota archaeon]
MERRLSIINWHEALLAKVFRIATALRLFRLFRFRVSFSTYSFFDYFKGFENNEAVKRIFEEKTDEVLRNLRVEFFSLVGYMGVNGSNGNLIVNPDYLNNGDKLDVYLDVIHELVHIRQFMEGKELFDGNYSYVERPTEIEAYRYAVEEARRLGQSDERILSYLKTPWMSDEDLEKLARTLNVKCKQ